MEPLGRHHLSSSGVPPCYRSRTGQALCPIPQMLRLLAYHPESLEVFFDHLDRQDALIHKNVVDVGRCCLSHGLILLPDRTQNARGHVETEPQPGQTIAGSLDFYSLEWP